MKKEESLDHTPLKFGKHRGETPEQVADKDPDWLVWAYETVKNRPVCSSALYRDCKEETSKPRAAREYDEEEEHLANAAYGYMGQN